jgi:hypothetical protein
MDVKKKLFEAYGLESKASAIYDNIFNHFTPKQLQNIQQALIDIIFLGDCELFKEINGIYKSESKHELSEQHLKEIQVFHRSAMAFSRRKAKESDSVIALLAELEQVANPVSQIVSTPTPASSTADRKERTVKPTKELTEKDAEKLIVKALDVIKRNDVKALLQQALIQLKLSVPIAQGKHFCATENLNETFTSESKGSAWWL